TQYTGVAAGSVLFEPNASGFTLTAPDQSVSSSGNFARNAYGLLNLSVSGLNGYAITGVLAEHTGRFDVSGNGTQALVEYLTILGPPFELAKDFHRRLTENGIVSEFNQTFGSSSPLYSTQAEVFPYDLNAWNGTSATMTGPTRFTYDVVFLPESSTLTL